jgi:uncharacterized GH25 family protein
MRIVFTLVLFVAACVVQAHDFWMQPGKHKLKIGEELTISFSQGEDLIGMPWPINKQDVKTMSWCSLDNVADVRKNLVEGSAKVSLKMESAGTHLFVMESLPFTKNWSSEAFDEYLKTDGYDDLLFHRKKKNLADSVTESVTICSKLLVQVAGQNDKTFGLHNTLALEIIPMQNPYDLKVGDRIHFKILYKGRPLFGAQVKILNRYQSRTTIQKIYTQKDGIVETTLSNNGNWLVRVTTMNPLKAGENRYESFISTLMCGA